MDTVEPLRHWTRHHADRMPHLDWLGKSAVIGHHRKVPLRLLREQPDLHIPGPPLHTLVEGDNLEALVALLPQYRGRVDCIYIDPPYNTGNENWVYNDAVNSPAMRDWLGSVVGRDDLTRHDKWLCMMYPRLVLLREMLHHHNGSIWISIDDNELPSLLGACNEIFSERNFVACIPWIKRASPANDARYFSSDHEYIVVFAANKDRWTPHRLPRSVEQLKNYRNPDSDARGPWNSVTYTCNKTADERPGLFYAIRQPNSGSTIWPKRNAVWKYNEEQHLRNVADGLLYWGKNGAATMPRLKSFLSEMGDVVPRSFLKMEDVGSTQTAQTELVSIGLSGTFSTPKPTALVERLLRIGSDKNSIILDCFAGSGTTGHAVMRLNATDGGSRRCVLVQLGQDQADGPNIARSITRERLARVSAGYTAANGTAVAGLGQGWRYLTLSEHFCDRSGRPRTDLPFADLAPIVFHHATGEALAQPVPERAFLGVSSAGVGVYLLYNGDMLDKDGRSRNVLTPGMLERLHPHPGERLVYGAACRLDDAMLRRHRIVFRQYPHALAEAGA